jgi:hypothetical protein
MEFVGMVLSRLSVLLGERGRRRLFLLAVLFAASAVLPAVPAYAIGYHSPPPAVSSLVNK